MDSYLNTDIVERSIWMRDACGYGWKNLTSLITPGWYATANRFKMGPAPEIKNPVTSLFSMFLSLLEFKSHENHTEIIWIFFVVEVLPTFLTNSSKFCIRGSSSSIRISDHDLSSIHPSIKKKKIWISNDSKDTYRLFSIFPLAVPTARSIDGWIKKKINFSLKISHFSPYFGPFGDRMYCRLLSKSFYAGERTFLWFYIIICEKVKKSTE